MPAAALSSFITYPPLPHDSTRRLSSLSDAQYQRRVSPPDPRPEGRESRLFFDFLGRESTPEAKKGEKGPTVGSSGREFASNVKLVQCKTSVDSRPLGR